VEENYPQIGSEKIIFFQHKGIINGDVLIDGKIKYRYLHIDGMKYWVMGIIINKTQHVT